MKFVGKLESVGPHPRQLVRLLNCLQMTVQLLSHTVHYKFSTQQRIIKTVTIRWEM